MWIGWVYIAVTGFLVLYAFLSVFYTLLGIVRQYITDKCTKKAEKIPDKPVDSLIDIDKTKIEAEEDEHINEIQSQEPIRYKSNAHKNFIIWD